MICFRVFEDAHPADAWSLTNAYLIGADGNAMRGRIWFEDGQVLCEKREAGSAALTLQHAVGDLGEITLQTCLLPEREEPYLLGLELARHRLMSLYNKLEDWAMFDLNQDHPVTKRLTQARQLFVNALCRQGDEPGEADKVATECLLAALDGTEELALAHSELLLNRRRDSGALPKRAVGVGVSAPPDEHGQYLNALGHFDFLQTPMPWKQLAPEEGDYHWDQTDAWMALARQHHLPVLAGPLISFEPGEIPDWLYIWEHDYDTVRDMIYEHIEAVIDRYKGQVNVWNVVSGLHVNSHFSFTFDQLMGLTRMATMLVKKAQPSASVLIEIREPFGEYYAANPRSIPPRMYADLVVQSAVQFDGFGLRLCMGQPVSGQYTRDLMQISNIMDAFGGHGKPIYLGVGAPSQPITEMMLASPDGQTAANANSGYWRQPWSQTVQSHWLQAVFQIALSKPYIEAVYWQELLDHPEIELPLAGLVDEEHQPKGAFKRLLGFQKQIKPTA